MDENGGIKDNKILSKDRFDANFFGVYFHPSISINNITYRGEINAHDIFRAVCAGFKDQPEICKGDNIFDAIAKIEQNVPD
jgi:hypothetical protein